ncbi:uncharacterized protein V1518DRAFT_419876 [Limtongia smithiae]|uniref:uncharacterized protein n=1 Tax=Limtongia smithiae TaxID=1125753 RepID=UPI0034CDC0AB
MSGFFSLEQPALVGQRTHFEPTADYHTFTSPVPAVDSSLPDHSSDGLQLPLSYMPDNINPRIFFDRAASDYYVQPSLHPSTPQFMTTASIIPSAVSSTPSPSSSVESAGSPFSAPSPSTLSDSPTLIPLPTATVSSPAVTAAVAPQLRRSSQLRRPGLVTSRSAPSVPSAAPMSAAAAAAAATAGIIPIKNAAGKFQCQECTRSYLHAKHLKRHMLRHTGDRPYKCSLCSDSFCRSDILKRHYEKCQHRHSTGNIVPPQIKVARITKRVNSTINMPGSMGGVADITNSNGSLASTPSTPITPLTPNGYFMASKEVSNSQQDETVQFSHPRTSYFSTVDEHGSYIPYSAPSQDCVEDGDVLSSVPYGSEDPIFYVHDDDDDVLLAHQDQQQQLYDDSSLMPYQQHVLSSLHSQPSSILYSQMTAPHLQQNQFASPMQHSLSGGAFFSAANQHHQQQLQHQLQSIDGFEWDSLLEAQMATSQLQHTAVSPPATAQFSGDFVRQGMIL